MKSMPKTMETTLAIMLNSPQKTMAMILPIFSEWLYHSNQCQNKNPHPCSYQSLHNPDCCCQQAFDFSVLIITNKKNTSSNYSNYQVREMQDKNGKVIAYSAYNPNTGKNIIMKPEELTIISPLFAYCFQLSPVPPIAPSSCKPFRALLMVF
jgi:hypothetical protein